ncbi:hypothetical protein B0T13DRAFT_459542 [Neurospora crassa]|nr:hypothetical protein B0T13DRAFT_459542 [Neurospora crassa]
MGYWGWVVGFVLAFQLTGYDVGMFCCLSDPVRSTDCARGCDLFTGTVEVYLLGLLLAFANATSHVVGGSYVVGGCLNSSISLGT